MRGHLRSAICIIFAVLVGALLVPSGLAHAHTGLESTTPADGETVTGPLTEITLVYTAETTVSEKGFTVLRSDGTRMEPIQIDQEELSYTLVFNPGLEAGDYAVGWEVLAADGHPLDGSFQFTVVDPPPTTPAATTTDPDATVPDTTVPASTTTSDGIPTIPASAPSTSVLGSVDGSTPTTVATVPTTSPEFAELLDDSGSSGAETLARVGHLVRFVGVIFGVGAIAALLWVIQSEKKDLYVILNLIRVSGLLIAVGAAIEWAGYQEVSGGGFGELFSTRTGASALLSMLGGIVMMFGITEDHSLEPVRDVFRWAPGPRSITGIVGAGATVVAFGFDGHQPTRGPSIILSVVDVVHVGVAALWAGGVATLALIAWLRRRRGQPSWLSHSVVRFSALAMIGLIAVTVSGVIMTLMIVQNPSSPIESAWGRALLVKVIFVAMAAIAGAYNRFALLPAIEKHPDHQETAQRVRFSLTVEAVLFAVVVAITAILVTLDLNPM